jgi:hypothetical protein
MRNVKSSVLSLALVVTISSQLLSCGYVLHPERRGQSSGKVDLAIVGLDAIGLLFFIIPGLIAFTVDIYSGTIYMSNGHNASTLDWEKSTVIKIDPKNINRETIVAAIEKNTGIVVNLNDPRLKVYRDKKELELAESGI